MSTLSITNRTLALGSKIYQVSNITSVGKYRIRPNYFFKMQYIIICIVLGILGIELVKNNPDVLFLRWFIRAMVAFVILGILERFTKTKKYGLSIEMNSGSAKLIASRNERLVDSIVAKVIEIMNNKDAPVSYTFNIADGDIVNQSGTFETGYKTG